ncbi:MAG: hypothetical protein VKJ46_01165 [Leptolyngbyaceae bacterium]|nr:hypothetical protein [Leptolyngbyaceae bacterium]
MDGNTVALGGSANESANALVDNFECIDVFRSWNSEDQERVTEKVEDFQRLWDNCTPNLEVLEFLEAAQRSLLQRCADPFSIQEPRLFMTEGEY